MPHNAVRAIECRDWTEFISKVRTPKNMLGYRIFRGQRNPDWPLSSVWERFLALQKGNNPRRNVRNTFAECAYEAIRDGYLERFKQLAVGCPGLESRDLSDNDWWALGRHHNLTTPLLDWSRSPYVAAYFAFMDQAEFRNPGFRTGTHNGGILFCNDTLAIWELIVTDDMEVEGEFEVFTSRIDAAARQKTQQGVFTRLTHDIYVDIESYLRSRESVKFLIRYEIPEQAIGKALYDLDLMNINASTMFPDLEGAAARANAWNSFEILGMSGGT